MSVSDHFVDLKNIRDSFPILDEKVNNHPLIYFDNGATTQKPQCVIDAINTYYTKENSNIHRGVHYLSQQATKSYEDARLLIKDYLNASSSQEIIFTKGATEGINLVANSYGDKFINEGDEIILTELEHHSNYVPWHYLRKRKKAIIKFAKINENLEIKVDEIKKLITNKTKMIAITHISNVTGGITPLKEIVDLASSKNIPVLVDGTQGAPHLKLDMQKLGCDFYVISCHKMYGPNGLGILFAKKNG